MPSKKKPRPLFEVPVEIGSGRESGWVYRSGASETKTQAPRTRLAADTSIGATSVNTVAIVMAALAQTFVLGVTIATIPFTMGMRVLQAIAKPDAD